MENKKILIITGCLFGALSVALGAFGAHALKPLLMLNNRVDTYELAVKYQIYHAFAILIFAIIQDKFQQKVIRWSVVCFVAGIVCFSGSLYYLSITNSTSLVLITPLGGVFLIAGWLLLPISLIRKSN